MAGLDPDACLTLLIHESANGANVVITSRGLLHRHRHENNKKGGRFFCRPNTVTDESSCTRVHSRLKFFFCALYMGKFMSKHGVPVSYLLSDLFKNPDVSSISKLSIYSISSFDSSALIMVLRDDGCASHAQGCIGCYYRACNLP